jgi:hypothetical protein
MSEIIRVLDAGNPRSGGQHDQESSWLVDNSLLLVSLHGQEKALVSLLTWQKSHSEGPTVMT